MASCVRVEEDSTQLSQRIVPTERILVARSMQFQGWHWVTISQKSRNGKPHCIYYLKSAAHHPCFCFSKSLAYVFLSLTLDTHTHKNQSRIACWTGPFFFPVVKRDLRRFGYPQFLVNEGQGATKSPQPHDKSYFFQFSHWFIQWFMGIVVIFSRGTGPRWWPLGGIEAVLWNIARQDGTLR